MKAFMTDQKYGENSRKRMMALEMKNSLKRLRDHELVDYLIAAVKKLSDDREGMIQVGEKVIDQLGRRRS